MEFQRKTTKASCCGPNNQTHLVVRLLLLPCLQTDSLCSDLRWNIRCLTGSMQGKSWPLRKSKQQHHSDIMPPLSTVLSWAAVPLRNLSPHQFISATQLCPTLCDPMNLSTPGLLVHHQLPEFTQTHVHRVGEAIQPSHRNIILKFNFVDYIYLVFLLI